MGVKWGLISSKIISLRVSAGGAPPTGLEPVTLRPGSRGAGRAHDPPGPRSRPVVPAPARRRPHSTQGAQGRDGTRVISTAVRNGAVVRQVRSKPDEAG